MERNVVADACVDYMVEHGPLCKLRDMQESVMKDLGIPQEEWKKVSAVTRILVNKKILNQIKKGRSYWVSAGPSFSDHVRILEETDTERLEMLRSLDEVGGIRVESSNPLPSAMWSVVMKKFDDGELDLVFVPSRARKVAYQVEKGGKAFPLEFWDGMKYEQGRGQAPDVR